jgi:hypothetical protein
MEQRVNAGQSTIDTEIGTSQGANGTDVTGILTRRPEPNSGDASPPEAAPVTVPAAAPQPADKPAATEPARARRRGWVLPVAIAAVGLIASGTLGGVLWSTIGERDTSRHQFATTREQLTAARNEAATRQVTSDYVTLVAVEGGQAVADYGAMASCSTFGQCRTAAQQAVSDLEAFQSDRAAATVPPELANADGQLRDGLSAAIAAVQELIGGMDNNDLKKVKDGAHKLDVALLAIGKAEAALDAGSS